MLYILHSSCSCSTSNTLLRSGPEQYTNMVWLLLINKRCIGLRAWRFFSWTLRPCAGSQRVLGCHGAEKQLVVQTSLFVISPSYHLPFYSCHCTPLPWLTTVTLPNHRIPRTMTILRPPGISRGEISFVHAHLCAHSHRLLFLLYP